MRIAGEMTYAVQATLRTLADHAAALEQRAVGMIESDRVRLSRHKPGH
jgi:hypothetical protein